MAVLTVLAIYDMFMRHIREFRAGRSAFHQSEYLQGLL